MDPILRGTQIMYYVAHINVVHKYLHGEYFHFNSNQHNYLQCFSDTLKGENMLVENLMKSNQISEIFGNKCIVYTVWIKCCEHHEDANSFRFFMQIFVLFHCVGCTPLLYVCIYKNGGNHCIPLPPPWNLNLYRNQITFNMPHRWFYRSTMHIKD